MVGAPRLQMAHFSTTVVSGTSTTISYSAAQLELATGNPNYDTRPCSRPRGTRTGNFDNDDRNLHGAVDGGMATTVAQAPVAADTLLRVPSLVWSRAPCDGGHPAAKLPARHGEPLTIGAQSLCACKLQGMDRHRCTPPDQGADN